MHRHGELRERRVASGVAPHGQAEDQEELPSHFGSLSKDLNHRGERLVPHEGVRPRGPLWIGHLQVQLQEGLPIHADLDEVFVPFQLPGVVVPGKKMRVEAENDQILFRIRPSSNGSSF